MSRPNLPSLRRHRDLTILELDESKSLVVACDSAGGIGPKKDDVVQVPGYTLGRLTARVALMEVVAAGARPVCVVNNLCVEPVPTGADIQQGVADEIGILGINAADILTGSSEKNIPTSQSGVGITVIGLAEGAALRLGPLQAGDTLALFGRPKVGAEVSLDDPEIVSLETVNLLLASPKVREIVPVGSRGILAEAEDLASLYGLQLSLVDIPAGLDLRKSAGPATCLLAAGDEDTLKSAGAKAGKPFFTLGRLC